MSTAAAPAPCRPCKRGRHHECAAGLAAQPCGCRCRQPGGLEAPGAVEAAPPLALVDEPEEAAEEESWVYECDVPNCELTFGDEEEAARHERDHSAELAASPPVAPDANRQPIGEGAGPVFAWEPPPRRYGPRRGTEFISADDAAKLRGRPGEWARVREFSGPSGAHQYRKRWADRCNSERSAEQYPMTHWECEARRFPDGSSALWVRFWPPEMRDDEPT